MARENAQTIQVDGGTAAKLIEAYGEMIAAVEKNLVSAQIKNNNYINVVGGSVEVYRLQTAIVQAQGTARTAMDGNRILRDPISVNKDTHKEIVERWKKNEAEQAGISSLIEKRRAAHQLAMVSALDTAFFAKAVEEGDEVVVTSKTTLIKRLNALVQAVESIKNDYITNGVARAFLALTVTPSVYDELQDVIDTLPNPNGGGVGMDYYKGVRIFNNLNQTVDAICMPFESVAQPIDLLPYKQEDMELSPFTAVSTFFDFGTKAVMPELIKYATVLDEDEVSA